MNQFTGVYKWQAILKDFKYIIPTLEKFALFHRCTFVKMEQCANHIDYQLPNDNIRVTQLIDNIECDHAPLKAAITFIKNTGLTCKMNDFEFNVA